MKLFIRDMHAALLILSACLLLQLVSTTRLPPGWVTGQSTGEYSGKSAGTSAAQSTGQASEAAPGGNDPRSTEHLKRVAEQSKTASDYAVRHMHAHREGGAPLIQGSTVFSSLIPHAQGLTLHFVLAHYNEDAADIAALITAITKIPFIGAMQSHVHVFSKAPNQAAFDPSVLSPWNYTWTALKDNVGKESESYLQYIVQHYHSLPDYILFCQAQPHNLEGEGHANFGGMSLPVAIERLGSFSKAVHMMGLALVWRECSCGGCDGSTDHAPLFGQIYAMSAKRLCPKGHSFPVTLQGQFIVRRQGILRHHQSFYRYLLRDWQP